MTNISYSTEDLIWLHSLMSNSYKQAALYVESLGIETDEELNTEINNLWQHLRVEQLLPLHMPLEAKDSPTPVLAITWLQFFYEEDDLRPEYDPVHDCYW